MGQAGQKRVKSGCMYTIYICFNSGFDQIYFQTQKLVFPFFRFLTSNGTKGGWDESIHVYMTLCCKWKKAANVIDFNYVIIT